MDRPISQACIALPDPARPVHHSLTCVKTCTYAAPRPAPPALPMPLTPLLGMHDAHALIIDCPAGPTLPLSQQTPSAPCRSHPPTTTSPTATARPDCPTNNTIRLQRLHQPRLTFPARRLDTFPALVAHALQLSHALTIPDVPMHAPARGFTRWGGDAVVLHPRGWFFYCPKSLRKTLERPRSRVLRTHPHAVSPRRWTGGCGWRSR